MNYGTLSNANLQSKAGFYAGVSLPIRSSDLYTIQPEIGYTNQGGKSENPVYPDVTLDYLYLGVANTFYLQESGLHFIIGPSIEMSLTENIIGGIPQVDLAFFGGLGYEFDFGLVLEARFKHGVLTQDFEDDQDYSVPNNKGGVKPTLNRLLQIGIVYKINF